MKHGAPGTAQRVHAAQGDPGWGGTEEVPGGGKHPPRDPPPRPALPSAGYSLGQTPFELEPLAAAVGQAVQGGERPDGGQLAVGAVRGQHP